MGKHFLGALLVLWGNQIFISGSDWGIIVESWDLGCTWHEMGTPFTKHFSCLAWEFLFPANSLLSSAAVWKSWPTTAKWANVREKWVKTLRNKHTKSTQTLLFSHISLLNSASLPAKINPDWNGDFFFFLLKESLYSLYREKILYNRDNKGEIIKLGPGRSWASFIWWVPLIVVVSQH